MDVWLGMYSKLLMPIYFLNYGQFLQKRFVVNLLNSLDAYCLAILRTGNNCAYLKSRPDRFLKTCQVYLSNYKTTIYLIFKTWNAKPRFCTPTLKYFRVNYLLRVTLLIIALLFLQNSVCFAADPLGIQQALGLDSSTSTTSTTTTPDATTTTVMPTVTVPTTTTPPITSGVPVPVGSGMPTGSIIPPATAIPAPITPPSVTLPLPISLAPTFDYSINANSDVFGAQLFTGHFATEAFLQFNSDYALKIGDQIQVRLWGGYTLDALLSVDPRGNLFIPQVGPIKVLGVHNQDLQPLVESAVRRVFRANVYSYASLAAAQPVRIFVGGFVNRPGLYNGTSMDSLLHYLDQAGGIDAERGSFLNVQVKRGEQLRIEVNLYDFLLNGQIPLIQLADGDIIFVSPKQSSFKVSGFVANSNRFEFKKNTKPTLTELARLAKPSAQATHVRIIRNTGILQNIDYYPLADSNNVIIASGDTVEFTADKRPGTITVRVLGEHQSPQEYVVPYGTRIGEVLKTIEIRQRADLKSVQLFRQSVHDRQKLMLQTSLKNLEASVLTASSGSADEAQLRKQEAALILQWVDRAKTIEPNGQVLIAQTTNRDNLLLENGDVLQIPRKDGLILVSGEVLFPNAIAYNEDLDLEDYIAQAGGYTQNANNSRIVIAHRDGSFDDTETNDDLREGDEIMVLPQVQVKNRQILKELTQIIYQIAISARMITKF